MMAEGIAAALDRHPCIVSAGVATSPEELEGRGERVEAVVVDGGFPGAPAAAARLRAKGVRVVFLGGSDSDLDEGIRVSTTSPVSDLVYALVPGAQHAGRNGRAVLTPREQQVLDLVAKGMAAKQVARHLGISPKTVELHKSRIYAKLGVPNQAAAVHWAMAARAVGASAWSLSST
jgi:DNA-binding CsgD family transcriptional regulator